MDIFLHASLLVRRFHIAGRRLKEIVGAKIEEARIQVDTAVESV